MRVALLILATACSAAPSGGIADAAALGELVDARADDDGHTDVLEVDVRTNVIKTFADFTALCGDRCGFTLDGEVRYAPHPGGPDPDWFTGSVRRFGETLTFDLSYGTTATPTLLRATHDALTASLPVPPHWLRRTGADYDVVSEVATLHWTDVAPAPGEGYTLGHAAGRVLRMAEQAGGAAVGPEALIILPDLPLYIPPVAGILTAVRQTPLAHLNLLAASRGTPNAFVAAVAQHPGLVDWATHGAAVGVAVADSDIDLRPLTEPQYAEYLSRAAPGLVEVRVHDLAGAPLFVDLDTIAPDEARGQVPLIGGKAAGMAAMAGVPAITRPPRPFAVTVRPYAEHVGSIEEEIAAMLVEPDFAADARTRFVALEGATRFAAEHAADPKSLEWLDGLKAAHPAGTVLGDLLLAGGLEQRIRALPISAAFEDALTEALTAQFAPLATHQGLRFRSSSTVEDVTGFNGAGLYDSNTGFGAPPPGEEGHTYAWALLKTWASYWSFAAFEERRKAKIDHLDGRMAVLIHPRFEDAIEEANAVVVAYAMRTPAGLHQLVVVNAQPGSHSVTNPGDGSIAQAEIDRVDGLVGDSLDIERAQASELSAGEPVLSDSELRAIHGDIGALAALWLDQLGRDLPEAQRPRSVVLDLELKRVQAGWPAAAAQPVPAGLVYKQVRTLERPSTRLPELLASPTPRDLLARLASAERRVCVGEGLTVETLDIRTDAALPWGALNAVVPFTPSVTVSAPSLGDVALAHTDCALLHHPNTTAAVWDLEVVPLPGAAFESLRVLPDGTWTLTRPGEALAGADLTCTVTPLVVSAPQYLRELMDH